MTQYGHNFGFRTSPFPEHRLGRYIVGATPILIGAPVEATGDPDAEGRRELALVTGTNSRPTPGKHGIVVYEQSTPVEPGQDFMFRPSDLDTAPASRPAQLIHGDEVKVWFVNNDDLDFQGQRDYTGRTMVAGLGATPTLSVDDFLEPGVGDDTDGYWAATATQDDAWLRVTNVQLISGSLGRESVTALVEAVMLF